MLSTDTPPLELIATAAFGLEAVVARELRELGYEPVQVFNGGVLFGGDERAICRTNLWLRTADRVLIRVGHFPASDFGALFDGTRALPWERWIGPDGKLHVRGRSLKSQLSSVPACQRVVNKAVVERLKAAHQVETLPETGPAYGLEIALLKDTATLTIDTTGPGLHKRGYRPLTGEAPLKETLAAALLLLSVWEPERPLIDPFCGSGTIPIEAALLGRHMAPGLSRSFAAEAWPHLPAASWSEAREEARDLARPGLPLRIIGTDRFDRALGLARHHAERAGVAGDIHFQCQPFAQLTSKRDYGCVLCNPPYGERLSDAAEVRELYRTFPLVLRRLPTWSHFILTARDDFETLVGQSATRRRKLYNGRIECTFFQYLGPKPPWMSHEPAPDSVRDTGHESAATPDAPRDAEPSPSPAPVAAPAPAPTPAPAPASPPAPKPVFGGLTAAAPRQAEDFRRCLANRARHLRRWPARGITCFRLYERDLPEVPLAIDRYEDALHIAEFERPHERTPAEHADWLDLMIRTAGEVLDVPPDRIFVKHRRRLRQHGQYERLDPSDRPERWGRGDGVRIVHEGGLQFEVNLAEYVDTGLFLDHRITRGLVRDDAAERRVLNLFSYTGTMTVYAAAGGARETTSVDLSNTYLDWSQRNLRLNGFEGGRHRFVREDVLTYLRRLPPQPLFDLAIVDVPTHSRSKRAPEDWDVQQHHGDLFDLLLPRLSPGGIVYFSTNYRRFRLDEARLTNTPGSEAEPRAATPRVTIREISHRTVPEDFRNERIHRCWRIVVNATAEG